MYIETELDPAHLELMRIFFKANDLRGIIVHNKKVMIRGVEHTFLHFETDFEETELKLTFMALRHAGIRNMFDDFLLKCSIPVDALQPKSFHQQLQAEREAKQNEEFMDNLLGIER
jgi:hypothetical protein